MQNNTDAFHKNSEFPRALFYMHVTWFCSMLCETHAHTHLYIREGEKYFFLSMPFKRKFYSQLDYRMPFLKLNSLLIRQWKNAPLFNRFQNRKSFTGLQASMYRWMHLNWYLIFSQIKTFRQCIKLHWSEFYV